MQNLQIYPTVPESVANLQLPDPELLGYYDGLEDRKIWITQDIDCTVLEISKLILKFNAEDEKNKIPVEKRKPIKIFIYSYGGDGAACFSLIDMMKISKTPIWTINTGVAMSAGLLILLAGHKRFSMKSSTALIHSGSGGTQGSYEQTEAQMKDYKHFVQTMREYVIDRTKIDKKLLDKKKAQEWYIYADEQVELGIVHNIVENIDEII